jgi:hypothetical protein
LIASQTLSLSNSALKIVATSKANRVALSKRRVVTSSHEENTVSCCRENVFYVRAWRAKQSNRPRGSDSST